MDFFANPSCLAGPLRSLDPESDSDDSSGHGSRGGRSPASPRQALSVCSSSGEGGPKMNSQIFLFLRKIFENEPLQNIDFAFLSAPALEYLRDVLRRKFVLGPNFEGLELIKARRRNEERFKFVVKKGIKRLFKNFKKAHNGFIKGDKLQDELEFYRHYFWEAAGIDRGRFHAFLLPGSKIQKELTLGPGKVDKTVSFSYLARIFSADRFRSDFVFYLLNDFAQECLQTRDQKLLKIADNFEAGRRPRGNKLPWTRLEMVEAQKCFVDLVFSLEN